MTYNVSILSASDQGGYEVAPENKLKNLRFVKNWAKNLKDTCSRVITCSSPAQESFTKIKR